MIRILLIYLVYLVSVLISAAPWALFEIFLERFKDGWNGNFRNKFWGKKIPFGILGKIVPSAFQTPYHLLMFFVVASTFWMSSYPVGRHLIHHHAFWFWFFFVFLGAAGVCLAEDCLWFDFNTRFRLKFPDARLRLLRGDVAWQPGWIRIGSIMLPNFYIYEPPILAFLLYADCRWIGR